MKTKKSKLDQYAETLDELFAAGKTLQEAQATLREAGCSVSLSRLSVWWSDRQSERMQERLLGQITSGARQCREVEESFGRNPAPAVETIIKLYRVLAMQFATAGVSNPELIETSERATRMVLEFAKLEAKRADQALDERRVKLLEERAKLADLAQGVMGDTALSEEQRSARMRELFGMG